MTKALESLAGSDLVAFGAVVEPFIDDAVAPLDAAIAAIPGAAQAEAARQAGLRVGMLTFAAIGSGSTATAWVATASTTMSAYTNGTLVSFSALSNSAGPITIAIDGLAAIPVVQQNGRDLAASTLTAGAIYTGVINGGKLYILGTRPLEAYANVSWNSGASTTTSWVGTSKSNYGAFANGMLFTTVANSNVGPVTITLDGMTALPLRTFDGDDIANGQLTAGGPIMFVSYNGAYYLLPGYAKATTAQMQAGADKAVRMSPKQVQDEAARQAGLRVETLTFSAIGSGSTATAWVATAGTTLSAYSNGTLVSFSALSNSAGVTVNIDGLGAIPVVQQGWRDLANNTLAAGAFYTGMIWGGKLYVLGTAQIEAYANVSWNSGTSTTTAWVGTSRSNYGSYRSGMLFSANAYSNNGPVTVNIDGMGALPLRTVDGDELANNQLTPGAPIMFYILSGVCYLLPGYAKAQTSDMQAGADKALRMTPALVQAEILRQIGVAAIPTQASDAEVLASGIDGKYVSPRQDALVSGRPVPAIIIAAGTDGFAGSAGQWGASGATLSAESSDVRRPGVNVLKATATGAAGTTRNLYVRKKITASDLLRGRIEVWLKIPKVSAGSAGLFINWSKNVPSADPPVADPAATHGIFIGSYERADGVWTCISVDPRYNYFGTGSAATGRAWYDTETLPAAIQHLAILVQFDTNVPSGQDYFLLDQVAVNGKDRPSVMFMMDGYYASHATIMLPLMAARGLRGSTGSRTRNAPSTDTTGTYLAQQKAYLDALYAAGWDITQQGQRNGDPSTGYPGNYSTLAADIASAKADLIAAGYTRGLDVFSYMFNARSPATDAILAANGMLMARGQGNCGLTRSQLGKGAMLAAGCVGTDLRTGAQMVAALDAAIAKGEHIIFFGHDVVDAAVGTLSGSQTSKAELAILLDAVQSYAFAERCRVEPPSEFLKRVGG